MVKKKRNAEACPFIFGGCAPCSTCASWKRRMSSPVAVSGERPRNLAKANWLAPHSPLAPLPRAALSRASGFVQWPSTDIGARRMRRPAAVLYQRIRDLTRTVDEEL